VEGNGAIGVLAADDVNHLLSKPGVDIRHDVSTAVVVEGDLVKEIEEVVRNDHRAKANFLLQGASAAERKHFLQISN
jgi:hypothetical protein